MTLEEELMIAGFKRASSTQGPRYGERREWETKSGLYCFACDRPPEDTNRVRLIMGGFASDMPSLRGALLQATTAQDKTVRAVAARMIKAIDKRNAR